MLSGVLAEKLINAEMMRQIYHTEKDKMLKNKTKGKNGRVKADIYDHGDNEKGEAT